MILATLSVQKTGMITLPKKWRDENPAMQVMAEETPEGLLIRPISEIEYYEESNGSFGLRFPMGMGMKRFLTIYDKALKKVEGHERKTKRKRSSRT